MHLTRFGFNVVVLVYLVPLVFLTFVGNTVTEGTLSDVFYYGTMGLGGLILFAGYELFHGQTASISVAQGRQSDHKDEVIGFENVGAYEYIYCAVLVLISGGCWFWLHDINKHSTGILSMASLAWSFMSLLIAVLSAVQFWHLKSGTIVELKKRVVQ